MNTQNKIAAAVFVVILAIVILAVLWYKEVLTFNAVPLPVIPGPSYGAPAPAPAKSSGFRADVVMEDDDDEVIIDENKPVAFRPLKSENSYAVVSLGNEERAYAAAGLPTPNNSLYNISTHSYITGLGDPIRGDLNIEPRHSNMYKSQFTHKDARVGALSSIG